MNIATIKKLPKSVEVNLEQYECKDCEKKFYINSEDKIEKDFPCIFCGGETKNIRIFDVSIKGIGEY